MEKGKKMADCEWCKDEICVNADCPMCCDYCPVPDIDGVCRFEEREGKEIESEPEIDAVPVVRCKDCKYFMEYTEKYKRCVEGADGDCRIRLFHSCDKQFIACKYSNFCSYGERK